MPFSMWCSNQASGSLVSLRGLPGYLDVWPPDGRFVIDAIGSRLPRWNIISARSAESMSGRRSVMGLTLMITSPAAEFSARARSNRWSSTFAPEVATPKLLWAATRARLTMTSQSSKTFSVGPWTATTGGGTQTRTLEELAAQRAHLQQLCQSLKTGTRPSARIQPLSEQHLLAIRRVLSPKQESGQEWLSPSRSSTAKPGYGTG